MHLSRVPASLFHSRPPTSARFAFKQKPRIQFLIFHSFPKEAQTAVTVCLSVQMHFSLYLYGNFNGSLLVAIEEEGQTAGPLVWERKGPWTDDWEDIALLLTGLPHGSV